MKKPLIRRRLVRIANGRHPLGAFDRLVNHEYPRLVVLPVIGTGYLPSPSATSGAGESIVRLSTIWRELMIVLK